MPRIPVATYRLQLNHTFTFRDATRIVPYLHALGITDCYVSSILKAVPGSMHGYDLVDYRGNHLIEALPPPVAKEKWKERLEQLPVMMPEERELPPELRLYCVLEMKKAFIVQARHLEICEKADILLRSAYVGVSMGESERRRRAQEWYACVQSGQVPDFGLGAQASGEFFSIIGSSGMGKTQSLLHFLGVDSGGDSASG